MFFIHNQKELQSAETRVPSSCQQFLKPNASFSWNVQLPSALEPNPMIGQNCFQLTVNWRGYNGTPCTPKYLLIFESSVVQLWYRRVLALPLTSKEQELWIKHGFNRVFLYRNMLTLLKGTIYKTTDITCNSNEWGHSLDTKYNTYICTHSL